MLHKKLDRKNKLKILRIKARLTIGGPDIHVLLLNSGLDRSRFESYLAVGTAIEDEPDMTHLAYKMGINTIVIPELKKKISIKNDIIALIKLYKIMRKIKPDIVHTHTAKAGTLGRIAAVLSGVPIKIHTYHGHVFHSYFNRLKTSFFISIERLLARFTDKIITISRRQLEDVETVYKIAPADKCALIPLGLELEPFLSLGGKEAGKSTLSVGTVGRLVDVKNHSMFLDVVKKIKTEAPEINVRFVIVGGGILKDRLTSYAKELGIDDSVVFTGYLSELVGPRAELISIYRDLDIVVLTSLNEGTPISLIEGMASGKAVVSTDVGGVRDVVTHGESGLLSPCGDVDGFCRNLLSLLQDKDRRTKIGENGRSFVSKRFSKERLIKDIETLYLDEADKKRFLSHGIEFMHMKG